MGVGMHEKSEDENPSEDEREAEKKRLNDQPQQEGIELRTVTPTQPREVRPPVLVIGEKEPPFKTSHLKYALLTFNGIIGIFGLLVLIIAIWVRVDPEFWQYENSLDISSFYMVCNMLIAAGLIIVLIAFLGCLGILAESQWMLITYFVIFFIIFVVELAAVIMVWSAPYSSTIKRGLEKQIKKQIDKTDSVEKSRYFVDFLQKNLKCCGAEHQRDFKEDVPRSCRSPDTGNVYADGCGTALLNYLRGKAGLIGGVAVPILVFQLFAKFVCYCLLYNIRRESRYKMRD